VRDSIYRVKPFVPRRAWSTITAPYWWWYNRARHRMAAKVDSRLRKSARRLETMRDAHPGERCFIIGNGPSLRTMDLGPLKDEYTFGMNRIYLHFPAMGFPTTYYVAVNTLVIEQCADEILGLAMPRFVTWRGRRWFPKDADVIFVDTDYTGDESFSRDVSGRVFEGSTVTYVALQIAFHLGFGTAILIGVDHDFATKGTPNTTVTSAGDDPDHFSSSYFGKGFRWQLPDLVASERAYHLARKAYEMDGRQVLDATVGGKLTVFPKVDYASLFRNGR
jgi:hypothetical protein